MQNINEIEILIKLINDTKKTELYKKVLSKISDAILTEVILDKPKDD